MPLSLSSSLARVSFVLGVVALLGGCASTGSPVVGGNVQYGDSKAVETVTNEFGSTDLQTIAESMTRSLLQSQVIARGGRPLVTVADVKNKTSEYIDTRSVTDSIRAQLLKSGAVRFAVDHDAMQAQTDELIRQNQTGLYKKSATKKIGRMQGADYRLEGNITSIVKRSSSVKDVYYKFSLVLVDIESGVLEWADEKEIRKTSVR
ncbi:putative lipoprotein [Thiobacillus denitrificans ATCC 25259]|uniref:Penicillin-binding protein activator LpoB n=1 Tax=Thiobacillus denitrificans (strain ATCC 25259 / T1) TaxID=292415 RepID=Q3SFY9_THIDA|nr:penicillin-binding protein activator LpoB [Thiobacillus denitrificans]AAZ98467.1 putative lipoprotein [Thiobacillus denitrificans ATCC 25259]